MELSTTTLMNIKTFTYNNITLTYREWNQGKTPLLLLHGLADHGGVWEQLGDNLQTDYHVIAPDLRGHGNSSKPTTGYFSEDIITDLTQLMNDLGWEKAHILGHSWTGKLIPYWATLHPERFLSMIIVDPFYIGQLPQWMTITFPFLYKVLPFLKIVGEFESYDIVESIARQLKQYQGWSPLQEKVFQYSVEKLENGRYRSKFVTQARDEVFTDVMLKAGLWKPLDIPTLFIKPQEGLNRAEWQWKLFKQYIPQLTFKEVTGNHWAFLMYPEEFQQVVKSFLSNDRCLIQE